jgi:hypothetical protein
MPLTLRITHSKTETKEYERQSESDTSARRKNFMLTLNYQIVSNRK